MAAASAEDGETTNEITGNDVTNVEMKTSNIEESPAVVEESPAVVEVSPVVVETRAQKLSRYVRHKFLQTFVALCFLRVGP